MDKHTSGVRVALQGGPDSALQAPVVLEDEVIVDSRPDIPSALAVPFGLIYALHIEYDQVGCSLRHCKSSSSLWMLINVQHALRQ